MSHGGSFSEEDVRIAYIRSIVTFTLQISPDLWTEFIWHEDNQLVIKDFLDTPSTRFLMVFVDRRGKLAASIEFPPSVPSKAFCFLKYEDVQIPQNDFKQCFERMTLSSKPLDLYRALYEKVFMPILCNPLNNEKWPKEVFGDIVFHVQDFRKVIYFCLGQAKQRALLPIPEDAEKISGIRVEELDASSVDHKKVRPVLESIGEMVIDWNDLINELLELPTKESSKETESLGPQAIIEYWRDRKENLRFIFMQMDQPIVKQMAIALEKTESCHLEIFKKLLRGVAEALNEAEDVADKLEILTGPFDTFSLYNFEEIQRILPELMKSVTAAWLSSKHFSSKPSQIRDLVYKICNLLIKRARDYLKGAGIFEEDRALSQGKVVHARNVLDTFIDAYYECRETMPSPFEQVKVYPWEFPDNRVFGCMKWFHKRLEDIEKLFEAADTYSEIPSFELYPFHLLQLKHLLNNIFREFFEMYKVFTDGKNDPLDPENKAFEDYLSEFRTKVYDLDHRFGAAIGQGCLKCPLVSEAFELMEHFGGPLSRPVIESEFKMHLPDLIEKARGEMHEAKRLYEEQAHFVNFQGYCNVYQKLPPVTGTVRWALELEEKISKPVFGLQRLEEKYSLGKDVQLVYQVHEELMERLEKFRCEITDKWSSEVLEILGQKLSRTIIIEEEGIVKMNYDQEISKIMSEIDMLKTIRNVNVPEEASLICQRHKDLRCACAYLSATLGWFNKLREDLYEFEQSLIEEKWKFMVHLLDEGKSWTWKDPGLQGFTSKMYHLMEELFNNMKQTKENVNEVRNMIEIWSSSPMYCRKTPEDPVDFRIYMTPAVRAKYNMIKETDELMKQKVRENLYLFNCDPESYCWKDYVKYLETIIEDGLKDACSCSLKYLFDNTDGENPKLSPFIVIYVSLDGRSLKLDPPLAKAEAGSLMSCIQAAIEKIFNMGSQIKRLTDSQNDYEKALQVVDGLIHLRMGVIHHFVSALSSATKIADSFKVYESFYKNDVNDILKDYLLYGPAMFTLPEEDEIDEEEALDDEEIEGQEIISDEGEEIPLEHWCDGKPPTEDEFRQQISNIEKEYRKAEEIKNIIPVESWFVFDMSSFKESLLVIIRSWVSAFKHCLIEQKSLGKLRKVAKDDGD